MPATLQGGWRIRQDSNLHTEGNGAPGFCHLNYGSVWPSCSHRSRRVEYWVI